MKKVLSLVLAVMLVVGMASVGFAALAGPAAMDIGLTADVNPGDTITGTANVTAQVTAATVFTLSGGTSPIIPYLTDIAFTGTAVDSTTLGFSAKITAATPDVIGKALDGTILFSDGANTLTITITGGKKVVNAAIPTGNKITGVVDTATLFQTNKTNKDALVGGDKLEYQLYAGMFEWETPVADAWKWAIPRESQLTSGKIKVRVSNKKNCGDLKKLELDKTKVVAEVVKYFTKTKDVEGSFSLQITQNGTAKGDALDVDFIITLGDPEEVDEGQETATVGHNKLIEAIATVRGIELETDDEVLFFTTNMSKGNIIYAAVTTDLSSKDEELVLKHQELDSVYTVYSTGIRAASTTAEFKDLDDTYFVYDENYNYIGTTADKKLPFSNKYYLTTKKIDLGGTEVGETPEPEPTEPEPSTPTPTDPEVPGTGGDSGTPAPSNPTFNPNTGL